MADGLDLAAGRPPHPPLRGDLSPQGEVKQRQGRASSHLSLGGEVGLRKAKTG